MHADPTGMLHDMHGGGGPNYEGPTYILSQKDDGVGDQRFGLSTVEKSGCGPVAIYNALFTMEETKSLRSILGFFNRFIKFTTLLYGYAGTTPDAVMKYFKVNGYQVTYTSDPEIADALSKTADACIMYYIYERSYLGGLINFVGHHFIEYHRVDGGYTTVNDGADGGFGFFKNPSECKYPFVVIFINK